MKHLFIHIGAHKTASTYIQNFLAKHKDQLASASLCYDPDGPEIALNIKSIINKEKSVETLRSELRNKYNGINADHFLVSAEGFFGSESKGYFNIDKISGILRQITKDFHTTIIAFVRKQNTFIESLYHQQIKQGQVDTFDEYIQRIDIYAYKWNSLLKHYANNFGIENMYIFSYEDLLYNNKKTMESFFRVIGLDVTVQLENYPIANPSLSKKGLEIARRCNSILTDNEKEKLRYFLQKNFAKTPGSSFDLFTSEQIQELNQWYEKPNQLLKEHFKYVSILDPDVSAYNGKLASNQ